MPNKAQWNGQIGIVANSDFVSGIRFCWGGIFLIWRRRRKLQRFFSFWVEWASLPTQTEEAASSKSSKVKVKVSLAQKAPEIVNVEVIWYLGTIHEVNDGGCTLSPQSTPSSHPLNAKCSLEMVRVRPEKKLKSHLIWRMMEWALMSSPSQPFEQGRSPLDWMPLTKSSLHKVEFSLFCIGSVNCYCASQKKISSGIQTMGCLKISLNERSSLLLNKMLRSCIREQKSLQRFSKNWILFNLHQLVKPSCPSSSSVQYHNENLKFI